MLGSKMVAPVAGFMVAALLLTACPEQGPAEKAGEKIDEAAEEARDAVD
jgi:hypothetical protein